MAKTEAPEGATPDVDKKPKKKAFKKRGEKRVVHHGDAHIQASFNNTVDHDHRRRGQRRVVVERRRASASRARARARRSRRPRPRSTPARRPRARHALARSAGQGPGRRPRVGGPRAADRSASTSSRSATSRRSRTTAAGRPSAAASDVVRRSIRSASPRGTLNRLSPARSTGLPSAEALHRACVRRRCPMREGEYEPTFEGAISMARYTGPVCRLCRREGMKLFLKGERCYTEKCAIEKRNTAARPARQVAQGEAASATASSCARSRRSSASTACSRTSSAATSSRRRRHRGVTGVMLLQSARDAPRQRRLPPRLRHLARPGAPAGAPRPLPGQRQEGRHPVLPGARWATRCGCARPARKSAVVAHAIDDGQGPRRAGVAPAGRRQHARPRALDPDARRDQPADAGTAHRRALLEVTHDSPRGAGARLRAWRGEATERTRHAVEGFPAAEAARVRA